jgi:hypothetical protein
MNIGFLGAPDETRRKSENRVPAPDRCLPPGYLLLDAAGGPGPVLHRAPEKDIDGGTPIIQIPRPTDIRSVEDVGHDEGGKLSSPSERQRITILLDPYMLAKIDSISVSVQPRRISRT